MTVCKKHESVSHGDCANCMDEKQISDLKALVREMLPCVKWSARTAQTMHSTDKWDDLFRRAEEAVK